MSARWLSWIIGGAVALGVAGVEAKQLPAKTDGMLHGFASSDFRVASVANADINRAKPDAAQTTAPADRKQQAPASCAKPADAANPTVAIVFCRAHQAWGGEERMMLLLSGLSLPLDDPRVARYQLPVRPPSS